MQGRNASQGVRYAPVDVARQGHGSGRTPGRDDMDFDVEPKGAELVWELAGIEVVFRTHGEEVDGARVEELDATGEHEDADVVGLRCRHVSGAWDQSVAMGERILADLEGLYIITNSPL